MTRMTIRLNIYIFFFLLKKYITYWLLYEYDVSLNKHKAFIYIPKLLKLHFYEYYFIVIIISLAQK